MLTSNVKSKSEIEKLFSEDNKQKVNFLNVIVK